MNKKIFNVLFFSIIFIVIDQAIKILISSKMILNQSNIVINNFLSLTLVHNTGAAFSILADGGFLLIVIGIMVVIGLLIYLLQLVEMDDIDVFNFSLLFGGIVGNLIDRIFRGYVIDYLSFSIGSYYFPIFNFADVCIVCSVILIFIFSLKEELWK